jgi:hypothetical protein
MRFASTLADKSIAAAPQNDARDNRATFGLINQWSGGDHTFAPSTVYQYGVTVRRVEQRTSTTFSACAKRVKSDPADSTVYPHLYP